MGSTITTDIEKCKRLLSQGELVAIPTETVYGLAANIFNEDAVQRIFQVKGRPSFNPLIVHIHDRGQLGLLTTHVPKSAYALAEAFWPGSLTLVLPKQDSVPMSITAGKDTVAVRMPNHPLALELLQGLSFPIAAPSANPSTRVSPTSAAHVEHYFGDRIPAILDGGTCQVGLESTIVGFDGETPIIYRKGGISVEAIEAIVGSVILITENETTPQAPGMSLKHYAPKTPLRICDNLTEMLSLNPNKKVGILSFYEDAFPNAERVIVLSKDKNLEMAAQGLFAALHTLDAMGLDLILAERFPEAGLGRSINDRLFRAQN